MDNPLSSLIKGKREQKRNKIGKEKEPSSQIQRDKKIIIIIDYMLIL